MADSFFLSGLAANACINAQSVVVSSEHALADFQKAALQNGHTWSPFIFDSTPAADEDIQFDMNMVPNGSYEDDGDGDVPTGGWVVETGTPTVSNAQAHEGSVSLRLNSAGEAAYIDITVIAGKRYQLEVALWGGGSGEAAEFYLIDLKTGKYKTSASETSWSAASATLFSRDTSSFANNTQTLVVDAQAPGGNNLTTLRLRGRKEAGTVAAYMDLVLLYPEIDLASLQGYSFHDQIAVKVFSDVQVSFGTEDLQATLPTRRHRTFKKFTPTDSDPRRFWRYKFEGTAFSPIRVNQPWMGEATIFTPPRYPGSGSREMPQADAGGLVRVPTNLSEESLYSYDLEYTHTAANFAKTIEQMIGQSKNGVEPVLVVLDSSETDRYPVAQCRAPAEHPWERPSNLVYKHTISLVEDPFGLVTSG